MPRMVEITCAYCGCKSSKAAGHVNRSRKIGAPLYCNKECYGLAQRSDKSADQKKSEKAEYDRAYRAKNWDARKKQKAEYYQRTKDPEKERIARKARMHKHVEYCRRPEYKAWKKEYDRRYRAQKAYGEFAECFLLTQDIREECLSQSSDYQIRLDKGGIGKSSQRKKDHGKIDCDRA